MRTKKIKEEQKDDDEFMTKGEFRKSFFEWINKVEKFAEDLDANERTSKKALKNVEEFKEFASKQVKELCCDIKALLAMIQTQQKLFLKIVDLNEMVDETLSNALLAIRQNEYLQAWYPEQQGHPQQKVVGKWPNT